MAQKILNWFSGTKEPKSPLKQKEGDFFTRNGFTLLSFFIPFILMFFSFYLAKLYPFGDNQIMVIDMWHQYFQFFKILHEKLQSFGSLLYTWQGGLGTNFIALISYYASSPLYLLSVFFPAKYLTEAMAIIVILKISLSGAFMCIYLKNLFNRYDFGTATFSILYALSAYAMGYYWCLMWLDVMALLPLCMLGLNKLIDEGKFRLYAISLALIMITNYYIGVMVCIFIALYYPVLYFSRTKAKGALHCTITTVKAVLFSAIGVAMASFILLPTYISMQNTYYIDQAFPAASSFYNPILDVINNLLPNVELTVRGGLPNIYCGLISFMLAILYLMCKTIPAKQKILNCLLLGFLILSFNWNKLDFIWHGLHFPNELPYRYSFCFTFILITMAYQAYLKIDDITPRQIGIVATGGFFYLILMEKIYSDKFDYKVIYVSILLLAVYSIALAIYKTGKFKESLIGLLLFIIVFGEMTNYTINSVRAVGNSNRTGYYGNYEDLTSLIKTIEKQDKSFYRMELARKWTTNDPALYGYRGVSQFSSEINSFVTSTMQNIGLAASPGSNRMGYAMTTPVINSMLNIKYIMGKGHNVDDKALQLLYTSNGSTLYKNKYYLSIGYMTNYDMLDWTSDIPNPFDVHDNFIWFATGKSSSVYNQLTDPVCTSENAIIGDYDSYSGRLQCSNSNANASSTVNMVFKAEKSQSIYAYVEAHGAQTIKGRTQNGQEISFENNRASILSLGYCQAGEEVYIDVTFEKGKGSSVTALVYGLNQQEWDEAYNLLNDEILNVTDFSDTKIKGTINVKNDGILMTSIPYEGGWKAKVNGKRVEINPIDDCFVSIELPAGQHEVVFSYIPAGFIEGVLISIFAALILAALYFLNKHIEYRNKLLKLLKIKTQSADDTDINEIVQQALSDEYIYYKEEQLNEPLDKQTEVEENIPLEKALEDTSEQTDVNLDDSSVDTTDDNSDDNSDDTPDDIII